MHVVVRKYTASPDGIAENRRNVEGLEKTMRSIPGFAAYYFIETGDGLATITVTEDETGTAESMGMAARWIEEHTLISATRWPQWKSDVDGKTARTRFRRWPIVDRTAHQPPTRRRPRGNRR